MTDIHIPTWQVCPAPLSPLPTFDESLQCFFGFFFLRWSQRVFFLAQSFRQVGDAVDAGTTEVILHSTAVVFSPSDLPQLCRRHFSFCFVSKFFVLNMLLPYFELPSFLSLSYVLWRGGVRVDNIPPIQICDIITQNHFVPQLSKSINLSLKVIL
jgi:hypothetical protein